MFVRSVHQKLINQNEIFYLKRNSATSQVLDLIFFIRLDQSFVNGIFHFIHSLSEEEVFPVVVQIIRESAPANSSVQNHTEFYKKFWRNVIRKSDEKGIYVIGFYSEIISDSSKVPTQLFSQTTDQ